MSTNLFFSSDFHFCHKLLADVRGMTVEEMNEMMIERHNKVVRPQDHFYTLGDVCLTRKLLPIVRRLNGHKRLIFGNHDIYEYKDYVKAGFEKMMAYRVLDGMIFSHIPVYEGAVNRFKANVHGHLHKNKVQFMEQQPGWPSGMTDDRRYLCVSMEQIDYTPISLEEIKKRLK